MCAAALSSTDRMLSTSRRLLVSAIGFLAAPRASGCALPSTTGCVVGDALRTESEALVSHVRSPNEALSTPWTRR
jgi:hypothetical protein